MIETLIALFALAAAWLFVTGAQMADATADTDVKARSNTGHDAFPIADGVTVYRNMLAQLEGGYINHWDESGDFMGLLTNGDERNSTSGLTGATSDDSPPEAHVDTTGAILQELSSVGGTPTQAKVGDLVYCADSDIANLTLTDTTNPPVGRLWRFRSATNVDVKLFTPGEHAAGIADATWNS